MVWCDVVLFVLTHCHMSWQAGLQVLAAKWKRLSSNVKMPLIACLLTWTDKWKRAETLLTHMHVSLLRKLDQVGCVCIVHVHVHV